MGGCQIWQHIVICVFFENKMQVFLVAISLEISSGAQQFHLYRYIQQKYLTILDTETSFPEWNRLALPLVAL